MKNLLILSCALSLMACASTPTLQSAEAPCNCPPEAVATTTVLDTCQCMVITAQESCNCLSAIVTSSGVEKTTIEDCNCLANAERFDGLSVTVRTNEQENIADCKCAIAGAEQSADLHTLSSDAVTWFGPKHAGGDPFGEPLACGPHCGCLNTHLIDHLSA